MFYSGFPWQESPRASVPGEARRPAVGSIVSRMRPGPKEVHFDTVRIPAGRCYWLDDSSRRVFQSSPSVFTTGIPTSTLFRSLREMLPVLDQALHAFVVDLTDRGLMNDVVIVMGGEFGRTPRIEDQTPDGRGHWPEAGFLWIGGGGLRTGQVIGATDRRGEAMIGSPIGMKNVLATVYRVLGIDTAATLPDYNGRPQYVLDEQEPLSALL